MDMQDDEVAVSHRVLTIPNLISIIRLAGVPLFLWLVLGPEADGWALAVLFVSGFTDWLDGYLARRLNQTSKLGEILDPVADRLYILATVIGLGDARHHPVVAGASCCRCATPSCGAWCRSCAPAATARCRCTSSARPPPPTCSTRSRCCCSATAPASLATLAKVFGWAFAIWGTGLYWWAGLLYAWQVRKLLADHDRRAPALDGG